jgi:signal peptidase II
MPLSFSSLVSRLRAHTLALMVGYCLITLAGISLDQSTKIHAQKSFLEWTHATDLHQMNTTREHLFTLGTSPAEVTRLRAMERNTAAKTSKNWFEMYLTYVRNPGAAWGAMANLPEAVRTPFFAFVTLISLTVVGWLFYMSHPGQRLYRVGLSAILSGALGNFVDRMTLGYVIDWIQLHWKIWGWEYRFPVFNAADIFINIGVFLIVLDLVINELALRRLPAIETPAPEGVKKAA